MRRPFGKQVLLALVLLLSGLPACKTFVDIAPTEKGSVTNPVLCDGPAGQRAYLKLLRGPEGARVEYEYLDSVAGPGDSILDRFLLRNPAYRSGSRSLIELLLDLLRPDPELPRWFRVYMDMYHPGRLDREPVPGFAMMRDPSPADDAKPVEEPAE